MMNANTPTYSGPMIDSSIVLTTDEVGFAQGQQKNSLIYWEH